MQLRDRSLPVLAIVGVLLAGLGGASVPPADATIGMLSHYELCEQGNWMSLGDITVKAGTGDIWLETGGLSGLSPTLVHATTTGRVIGSHDGSGIPNGFSDGFSLTFQVGFSPTGVFVGDFNERYTNAPGRLLKFSFDRNPAFVAHFKRPPGTIPSDATVVGRPVEVLSFALDGTDLVGVLDRDRLVLYEDNGTFVDDLIPRPGMTDEGDSSRAAFGGPGGAALAGRRLWVSDPRNRRLKAYGFGPPDPSFDNRYSLVHLADREGVSVGRLASSPSGGFYGLTSTGLAGFDANGSILEQVGLEGAIGLFVSGDGAIWVTRSDGILRLGQGGDPIPDLQNSGAHRCGPPAIKPSVPASQDLADRALTIVIATNEPNRVKLTGTLTVPTAARAAATYKLTPTSRRFRKAGKARLELEFSKTAFKAVRSAHERGRASVFRVKVTATDTGGTKRIKEFTVTVT